MEHCEAISSGRKTLLVIREENKWKGKEKTIHPVCSSTVYRMLDKYFARKYLRQYVAHISKDFWTMLWDDRKIYVGNLLVSTVKKDIKRNN